MFSQHIYDFTPNHVKCEVSYGFESRPSGSVEKAANICLKHHIVTVAVDPDMQVITRSQPLTEIDGFLFHQQKTEKCG